MTQSGIITAVLSLQKILHFLKKQANLWAKIWMSGGILGFLGFFNVLRNLVTELMVGCNLSFELAWKPPKDSKQNLRENILQNVKFKQIFGATTIKKDEQVIGFVSKN